MSRITFLCVLFLSGCGGLTPLNPDGEFGVDPDTGLGTDGGFDTGDPDVDTAGPATPPRLVSMSAASLGAEIEVSFQVEDDDDDLVGGDFELTVGGGTTGYAIPYDLATWSTATGVGTLRFPNPGGTTSTGCTGASGTTTLNLVGRVVDSQGLESGTKTASVSVGGGAGSIVLTEIGDTLDAVQQIGDVTPPCDLLGDIHGTGGGTAYGDVDIVELAVPVATNVTLSLSWPTAADYDLVVYDSVGYLLLSLLGDALPIAVSNNTGSAPEVVSLAMDPTELYYVVVAGWDGPAGAYTLSIR